MLLVKYHYPVFAGALRFIQGLVGARDHRALGFTRLADG